MLILAHVDFGAVALELHFVHQLIDEINTAAVVGEYVFRATWIGDRERIEAVARIAHHDQHAALFVASNAALDFLGGIVLATVNNGVGEGFAQRGFDLEFFPGGAVESARHLHDALNHGADGRGIGVERDLNAYHQFAAIELYRWKTAGLHGQVPPIESRSVTLTEKLGRVKRETTEWGKFLAFSWGKLGCESPLKKRRTGLVRTFRSACGSSVCLWTRA